MQTPGLFPLVVNHIDDQNPGPNSNNNDTKNDEPVDDFLRRIIPLNQWSAFFPSMTQPDNNSRNPKTLDRRESNSTATITQSQKQDFFRQHHHPNHETSETTALPTPSHSQEEEDDVLLLEAVPFNGDTDHSFAGSFPQDMDIAIPVGFEKNLSNISPIGNVSRYNDNDCPSDEDSDSNLDRILGIVGEKAPPSTVADPQQPSHPPKPKSRSTLTGASGNAKELLNTTLPTAHSSLERETTQLEEEEAHRPEESERHERIVMSWPAPQDDDPDEPGLMERLKQQFVVVFHSCDDKHNNHEGDDDHSVSTLGFPAANPPPKPQPKKSIQQRCRSTSVWLMVACGVLTVVLVVLLAVMPWDSAAKNNTVAAAASSSSTATEKTEDLRSKHDGYAPPKDLLSPTQEDSEAASSSSSSSSFSSASSPWASPIPTPIPIPSTESPEATPASSNDPVERPSRNTNLRPTLAERPRPALPPAVLPSASTDAPAIAVTNAPTVAATTTSPTIPPTRQPTQAPTSHPFSPDESKDTTDNPEASSPTDPPLRLPQVRLDMGPMVGHTTHESATLWAYYRKPAMYLFREDYALEILVYDADGWVRTIDEAAPDPNRNNAVFATIDNLEPLTVYRYEMRILGQIVGSGSFRTAPLPPAVNRNPTGSTFEYVLASCMDRSEQPEQSVWEAISTTDDGSRDHPDFALLAGDTIYLRYGIDIDEQRGVSFDRYWLLNYYQRTESHFADFMGHTPVYAVWNNHDYGAEVADRYQPGKQESLRAWQALWPNPPPASGSPARDGIYYSFYWGDVHYLVTDDHWNRDPLAQNRWGMEQTNWIVDELRNSRGTFKVVVMGSDVMERGWSTDLTNLGAAVTEHAIDGVLFHAGDIHRNEYKRVATGGFPYPVTQITSSGIAKVWRKPFVKIRVDTTLEDPTLVARFFGADAEVADDARTTWTNDPGLRCASVPRGDRGGEHSCTETIRLSDLTVPRSA